MSYSIMQAGRVFIPGGLKVSIQGSSLLQLPSPVSCCRTNICGGPKYLLYTSCPAPHCVYSRFNPAPLYPVGGCWCVALHMVDALCCVMSVVSLMFCLAYVDH
ncbi:hypothetical protein BDW60DRAFT_173189 [Aspergillus nidulans var. acristatus]